jgi:hypothetical protein
MELTVVEEAGVKVVEGAPDQTLMSKVADTDLLIEECMSGGVESVLLYAQNLTPAFFDLSSGEAGAILQKLRNYRIRLAVVCPPGAAQISSRFGEMADEERRGPHFGVFDTRDAAWEWLGRWAHEQR